MDTKKMKTQSRLNISENVVSTIAKNAIKELDGVFSLAVIPTKYNAFAPTSSAKSVRIVLLSETAQIDIAIIVDMNHKIKEVCEQVQTTVKDTIQNMTGITVSKVNVFVAGVHISNQK